VVDDFARPLPESQPGPYGALVVAIDFGEIVRDDLWRLCVWLVVTGCTDATFHGVGSARAEDMYDDAVVVVKLAIKGDEELAREISEVWAHPLGEFGAELTGVSVSLDPRKASLEETVSFGFYTTPPLERAIAIPLDARSGALLGEILADPATWAPDHRPE
jgi:hypothetical protein